MASDIEIIRVRSEGGHDTTEKIYVEYLLKGVRYDLEAVVSLWDDADPLDLDPDSDIRLQDVLVEKAGRSGQIRPTEKVIGSVKAAIARFIEENAEDMVMSRGDDGEY